MSILHDSLQRFERTGTRADAPWNLVSASANNRRDWGLSRKSWGLLAALGILSLAAWSVVVLWPAPSPRTGGIVSELPDQSSVSPPASQRPAPAMQRQEPSAPAARQRHVPLENIASRPSAGARDSLDQRMLAELNTQLSSLLAILAGQGTTDQGGADPSLEQIPMQGDGGGRNEWASQADAGAGQELRPDPVVHVSVQAGAEQLGRVDLEAIRRVEEELGQTLRDRDWQRFDLEYQRLENLKPHARDGLAQWRAARAIASSDYQEAQRILEGLRLANPRDLQTGLNLALVYEAQGRIASAREVAAELARSHPLEPRVQTILDRLENRTRR